MKKNSCRVCGKGKKYLQKIFTLNRQPKSAQGFITKKHLDHDKPLNIELYQCEECSVVQILDRPVKYYKDVIRATSNSTEMQKLRHDQFKSWVNRNKLQNKKILEIGSHKGENLEIAQKFCKNVYGLENSVESVNYSKNKKLKVFQGYLEKKFKLPIKFKFDAFYVLNFMEHWPNPVESFKLLHKMLNNKYTGIIEVPNFDMILKKKLVSEITLDHLLYFTKKTLYISLEKMGFDVMSISSIFNDYVLCAEIKNKTIHNLNDFNIALKNKIKKINKILQNYSKKDVAIWGAGHQSLSLICSGNIERKVSFIIDSAKFKQNLFSPVSHLEIKSPEILNFSKIKLIIIIAGSYNSEIESFIKKNYHNKFRIEKI